MGQPVHPWSQQHGPAMARPCPAAPPSRFLLTPGAPTTAGSEPPPAPMEDLLATHYDVMINGDKWTQLMVINGDNMVIR